MSGVDCSKPRVLCSVLEYACFEQTDVESLFTAIIVGHGRFECERLLKTSGVELTNLPQSATIGFTVTQRDRVYGQKHELYHAIVPLGTIHPAFFTVRTDESGTGSKNARPVIWESWLGLFGAEFSLKDHSPERLFQKCLENGASNRFPKLFVRLHFLEPGVPSPNRQPKAAEKEAVEPEASGECKTSSVVPSSSIAPRIVGIGSRLYTLAGLRPPPALHSQSLEDVMRTIEEVVGVMEASATGSPHNLPPGSAPSSTQSLTFRGLASVAGDGSQPSSGSALSSHRGPAISSSGELVSSSGNIGSPACRRPARSRPPLQHSPAQSSQSLASHASHGSHASQDRGLRDSDETSPGEPAFNALTGLAPSTDANLGGEPEGEDELSRPPHLRRGQVGAAGYPPGAGAPQLSWQLS